MKIRCTKPLIILNAYYMRPNYSMLMILSNYIMIASIDFPMLNFTSLICASKQLYQCPYLHCNIPMSNLIMGTPMIPMIPILNGAYPLMHLLDCYERNTRYGWLDQITGILNIKNSINGSVNLVKTQNTNSASKSLADWLTYHKSSLWPYCNHCKCAGHWLSKSCKFNGNKCCNCGKIRHQQKNCCSKKRKRRKRRKRRVQNKWTLKKNILHSKQMKNSIILIPSMLVMLMWMTTDWSIMIG